MRWGEEGEGEGDGGKGLCVFFERFLHWKERAGGGGRHLGSFERYVEEMREGGVIRGRKGEGEKEGGKEGGDIYLYARFHSYFESVLKGKIKLSSLGRGVGEGKEKGGKRRRDEWEEMVEREKSFFRKEKEKGEGGEREEKEKERLREETVKEIFEELLKFSPW